MFHNLFLGPSTCKDDEFYCGDDQCISNRWVCDNEIDCRSRLDELSCDDGGKKIHSVTLGEIIRLLPRQMIFLNYHYERFFVIMSDSYAKQLQYIKLKSRNII